MLKTRVITAIVLLAILLPVLFQASPWPFACVSVVMIGAAGWEWARLNGLPGTGAIAAGVALALACVWTLLIGNLHAPPPWVWWLASGVVGARRRLRLARRAGRLAGGCARRAPGTRRAAAVGRLAGDRAGQGASASTSSC